MRPFGDQRHGNLDLMVRGSGRLGFSMRRLQSSSIRYEGFLYWPFFYVVFSLLSNNCSGLPGHKWEFCNHMTRSKIDATVLDTVVIRTKLVLNRDLRWCLLVHNSNLLTLSTGFTALLYQTMVFRRICIFWRRRGKTRASTILYTNHQSIFSSCCGSLRHMLVIWSATTRDTCNLLFCLQID